MDRARQTDLLSRPAATSRRGKRARAARQVPNISRLSIALAGDEPPNEFRLFTAGTVDTVKGSFVFGPDEAEAVMAEYKTHGIDLMIDYDHASLGVGVDPALSGKAAGWFNLEVRDGELWAINVRWCPPAAEALRRKEWRFMSPAFSTDGDRIVSVMNVAITNLPATRRLEPLMAASVTALGENGMTVEEFLAVCKALDVDMSGSLDDALAKIKGEKPEEKPKEEPKPEVEPLAAVDPEAKPEEIAAALSVVRSLSGKPFVASVADVRTWHASHVELAAGRKAIAEREAVLEGEERRRLCVELVTLGGCTPATVWATPEKDSAPKAYLAKMAIDDLRAMHADAVASNGGRPAAIKVPAAGDVVAPAVAGNTVVTLSNGETRELKPREVAMCTDMKIDLKTYAATKPAKKG